jgi:hypothetical protein
MDKNNRKHTPVANPEYAQAMRELRRSGAAGTHDNRPKRERSRQDSKRAAIRRDSQ